MNTHTDATVMQLHMRLDIFNSKSSGGKMLDHHGGVSRGKWVERGVMGG